jgi:hypothetical protein
MGIGFLRPEEMLSISLGIVMSFTRRSFFISSLLPAAQSMELQPEKKRSLLQPLADFRLP